MQYVQPRMFYACHDQVGGNAEIFHCANVKSTGDDTHYCSCLRAILPLGNTVSVSRKNGQTVLE